MSQSGESGVEGKNAGQEDIVFKGKNECSIPLSPSAPDLKDDRLKTNHYRGLKKMEKNTKIAILKSSVSYNKLDLSVRLSIHITPVFTGEKNT